MTPEDLVEATSEIAKVTVAIERLGEHADYPDAYADVLTVRRFMKPHIDAELARIRDTATAMRQALLDTSTQH